MPACIELRSACLEFCLNRVGLGALSPINLGGYEPGGGGPGGGGGGGGGIMQSC